MMNLLSDREFRSLWAGSGLSQFAYRVLGFTTPLIAIQQLHASALQVGLVSSFSTAAFLIFGLPVGALIDRTRQRRLLITVDLCRAFLVIAIVTVFATDSLLMFHLYVLAFLVGVLTVFFDVGHQSYLPQVISREQLIEGNSRLAAIDSVALVAGPALAGAIISTGGFLGSMVVAMGGFVLSAALLARMRNPDRLADISGDRNLRREIGEGLRFVLGHPVLRGLAACTSVFNFSALIIQSMIAFRIVRDLGLSAASVGYYFTASGCGGIIGALVARRFTHAIGRRRAVWASCLLSGPFALLIPLAESGSEFWIAACGGGLVAAGASVYNVAQVSIRQELCPDKLLGRMNATMRFLVWGTMPLGGLAGGLLGSILGTRAAMWIGATGIVVSCLPVVFSPMSRTRSTEDGRQTSSAEGPLTGEGR